MTRQEAIDVIKAFVAYGEHVNAFVYKGSTSIPIEALNMAIKALDQEPMRGKWVDKGDFYVCSECGKRMPYAVLNSERSIAYAFMSDYCPHCGSAMEVESDEE